MRPIDADVITPIIDEICELEKIPMHIASTIIMNLDCCPTLDVKPIVKGKWIEYTSELDYSTETRYTCNRCGEMSCCKGNFCPDCGADMRGETNEESNT